MSDIFSASRIRRIRKALGLSQKEFGERLNRSQRAVSMWEQAKRTPSDYQTVLALLEAEGEALPGK